MPESDIKALERRLNRINHNVEYPKEQPTAISVNEAEDSREPETIIDHVVKDELAPKETDFEVPKASVPDEENIGALKAELEEYLALTMVLKFIFKSAPDEPKK